MAANSHSALAPVNFMPLVQDFLDNRLVAREVSRTEFKAQLRSGQSIDWPYITRARVQTYTPGTDLDIDANTAVSDTMLINQSPATTFTLDPNQQAQAEDKSMQAELADDSAYVLANFIDQEVIETGVDAATQSITGGVLSASVLYGYLTDAMATLQRSNAADRATFAILDPETIALLAQVDVANGFNVADSSLKNGFVGNSSAGFKIYNSNNLPTTATMTMDTIPTATDTVTIAGVEFTFVANGAAANAGEISIGANVAAAQANFLLAIAGTATGSAATYIDLAVEDRRILQNIQLAASAFAADVTTLTGFGKLGSSETYTAVTNGFSAETVSMLLGSQGAMSLGMQIMPTMYTAKEPKRPEMNYIIHTLYGKKVFKRDIPRLVVLTRTATAATI